MGIRFQPNTSIPRGRSAKKLYRIFNPRNSIDVRERLCSDREERRVVNTLIIRL